MAAWCLVLGHRLWAVTAGACAWAFVAGHGRLVLILGIIGEGLGSLSAVVGDFVDCKGNGRLLATLEDGTCICAAMAWHRDVL